MLDYVSQNWHTHNENDALQAAMAGVNEGVMSGIVAGTKVATVVGWQRVEDILPGDSVLTFDNGLKEVRAIRRVPLWNGLGDCPRQFRPLYIPANVLGNREAMVALPHQGLMIESDAAEAAQGDPFALVRAEALDGICGISRVDSCPAIDVFILEFEDDQIVFTAHGALCVCAGAGDMMARLLEEQHGPDYHLLSSDMDGELLADIRFEIMEAMMGGEARVEDAQVVYDMPRVA